jgi:NAD dependent epimerase/dehydratase family
LGFHHYGFDGHNERHSCSIEFQQQGLFMDKRSRIYVAGHKGFVGSAILRQLKAEGFTNLIRRSHGECDLENQGAVFKLFLEEKPEYVFLAAVKVGGIMANPTYPVDFIRSNLMVQNNVIDASHFSGVKKLQLSEAGAPTHQGGVPPNWGPGAYQRVVRHCQDRRHQYVPGLPCPAGTERHFPHAHVPLRAWR